MKYQIIQASEYPISTFLDNQNFECQILREEYQNFDLQDAFKFLINFNFKKGDLYIIYGKYQSTDKFHQLILNASNSHQIKKNTVIGDRWKFIEDENGNIKRIEINDYSIEFVKFPDDPKNLLKMVIMLGSYEKVVVIEFKY